MGQSVTRILAVIPFVFFQLGFVRMKARTAQKNWSHWCKESSMRIMGTVVIQGIQIGSGDDHRKQATILDMMHWGKYRKSDALMCWCNKIGQQLLLVKSLKNTQVIEMNSVCLERIFLLNVNSANHSLPVVFSPIVSLGNQLTSCLMSHAQYKLSAAVSNWSCAHWILHFAQ